MIIIALGVALYFVIEMGAEIVLGPVFDLLFDLFVKKKG